MEIIDKNYVGKCFQKTEYVKQGLKMIGVFDAGGDGIINIMKFLLIRVKIDLSIIVSSQIHTLMAKEY